MSNTAPPAFHLMANPMGAECNLDGAYCFCLSNEMLYPGSPFRMAGKLLGTYAIQGFEQVMRGLDDLRTGGVERHLFPLYKRLFHQGTARTAMPRGG